MSDVSQEDYDKLDFIYTVMQKKLDNQNDVHNTFNQKINFMLAFTGAALGFYVTLTVQNHLLDNTSPYLIYLLRVLGLIGLLLVILFLITAAAIQQFKDPPHEDTIYSDKALNTRYYDLKLHVIENMKKSYVLNLQPHKNIALCLKIANSLLFPSILILIVGIVL